MRSVKLHVSVTLKLAFGGEAKTEGFSVQQPGKLYESNYISETGLHV